MRVELRVYGATKYEATEEPKRIQYEINGFEVVTGERAKAIEAETDSSCIDEYHEYLVLHLANGETSTFRNSHVDMHEARDAEPELVPMPGIEGLAELKKQYR